MADWGEIIGTGLVGGLVGYADSKVASIMDEEAKAREDGLLRLKREWQIDDREWKTRMDDKNWQRQEQRDDKIWNRQQQLADTTFKREKGLLEDERAYQASLPGDIESEVAQLRNLFSDDEIKSLMAGKYGGKRKGGLTDNQEIDLITELRDKYKEEMEFFDDGSTEGGLFGIGSREATQQKPSFEEWLQMEYPEVAERLGVMPSRPQPKGGTKRVTSDDDVERAIQRVAGREDAVELIVNNFEPESAKAILSRMQQEPEEPTGPVVAPEARKRQPARSPKVATPISDVLDSLGKGIKKQFYIPPPPGARRAE